MKTVLSEPGGESDQDIRSSKVTYAVFKPSSAMPFFSPSGWFVTGAVYYRKNKNKNKKITIMSSFVNAALSVL